MLAIITILSIIHTIHGIPDRSYHYIRQSDLQNPLVAQNPLLTPSFAQSYCQYRFGTSLATITTKNENDYITSTCESISGCKTAYNAGDSPWACGCIIGLAFNSDIFVQEYEWVSGFPYDSDNDFTNFASGDYSATYDGNCGQVFKNCGEAGCPDGSWSKRPCSIGPNNENVVQNFFCNVVQQFSNERVCQGSDHILKGHSYDCKTDEPCGDEENAPEICEDLGDGFNRCYWSDKDVIHWGEENGQNRICGYDGDAECLLLDGTIEFLSDGLGGAAEGTSSVEYVSCLRCCPNKATGLNLCTETISTGQEQCGTIGSELFFYSEYDDGASDPVYFANIAPCCADQVCLDKTAGLCGVAGKACDPCTKWSYIKDINQIYHQGDSCGDDLICLDDGSDPLIKSKPYVFSAQQNNFKPPEEDPLLPPIPRRLFDSGDESIFKELPMELQGRHRRLQEGFFEQVQYNRGICVPLDFIGECDSDGDCADCMRCCDGKCKRIAVTSDDKICGYSEGRGPCCKDYECCNNECVTHSPTKNPTETPTKKPITEIPTKSTKSPTKSPSDASDEQFAALYGNSK
eukprot:192230_1